MKVLLYGILFTLFFVGCGNEKANENRPMNDPNINATNWLENKDDALREPRSADATFEGCSIGDEKFLEGEKTPSHDACNTCTCKKINNVFAISCTNNICE